MDQMKKFLETLSEDTAMTKQDFVLSVLIGVLAGIILGMLISPRKYVHIGCNNDNGFELEEDTFQE